MIGGRALITGHLAEDKLIIKKVKIGKNCLIGGESFIMPGVIIEDNVVVGAKSLVTKNKKLEKGKVYVGSQGIMKNSLLSLSLGLQAKPILGLFCN